ncbi:aminotransferase class I/II-fold pyridoxal phosphate-dependent enzyme [Deinococcus navajonensis]|uniref:Aminotransferase class I/II-fold pyridoxal phosphate-dependent enzyme n=1 Tax=Deinococcus navajonensis TaxID=309884 RepID=A0ABV8XHS4_9DEIO
MSLPPLLPRAPHGGPSSAPFQGLDFSVNTNPYGPNPVLLRAVRNADHSHYPDPAYLGVRQRLAAWHGREAQEVVLSTGASDLLHRLVRAFVPSGGRLLSLHAPFGELARAAALQRAQLLVVDALPAQLPGNVQLVYVGHPHNPTGRRLSPEALETVAHACALVGALLILDEAYAPFLTALPLPQGEAVVRLLSPGKAHGLVGARPAYALASVQVAARLENLAPAWHLPAGTAAALAALPEAQPFLEATLPLVQMHSRALAAELARLGPVEHHGTPYLTLEVGDAAAVTAALLAQGLRVRDCTSYGLPALIRVSSRTDEENSQLIQALQRFRTGTGAARVPVR